MESPVSPGAAFFAEFDFEATLARSAASVAVIPTSINASGSSHFDRGILKIFNSFN